MTAQPLADYQQEFIDQALAAGVLRFGEFRLKSGRVSPYFFNAGQFNTGAQIAHLGTYYAAAAMASGLDFDMVFGPAYKGIPLAVTTAISLARDHGRDVPWTFNRKESKDHGEGGNFVGAEPAGKVLLIDDVITAGTAVGQAAEALSQTQAQLGGVLISVDRQERGEGTCSAIDQVRDDLNIDVHAIVTLDDIIAFLQQREKSGEGYSGYRQAMVEYRSRYGVARRASSL